MVLRDLLSFGNPVTGFIVEIICYLYVDFEIKKKKVKELIASSRYSDNVNAIGYFLSEFDKVSEILINSIFVF